MGWQSDLPRQGYPQAILHVDGDAFFASVAQAVDPRLRGRPMVTGQERGIISAASYEAKARGVRRGVSLWDARKLCPELIVVPTDYETCSLFSKRMFAIMGKFTPAVQENGIDEGFADITGMRRVHHRSYKAIAEQMQQEIEAALGITVSIGLSLSKSLAKLCSDFRKPHGLVAVPGKYLHLLLARIPLEEIWGVGRNTALLLRKHGLSTALDYVEQTELFHRKLTGKVGVEIWRELRGEMVNPVDSAPKVSYQSIMKSRTFSPVTRDKAVLLAYLLRNLESACIKARRYHLSAQAIGVLIKTQQFEHFHLGAKLSQASAHPLELSEVVKVLFEQVFRVGVEYRASGVALIDLIPEDQVQLGLFQDPGRIVKVEKLSGAIDAVNQKFGKHKIHLAGTLSANEQHEGDRGQASLREEHLFFGENKRQRVGVPMVRMPAG